MNDLTFIGQLNELKGEAHSGYEIACFAQAGKLNADGQTYECPAGSVAVIPLLLPQAVSCASAIAAVIDKALLPVKGVTVIPAENARFLYSAVEQAYEYVKLNGNTVGVANAYGRLIASLITAYTAPNGFSPTVKAVAEDLEKHVDDPTYSLESFIRTLPLNYDYVRKLFKKEVGMTPHEYLTRARMERAGNILLSGVTNRYSEFTVTQIAETCGFAEPLYFSRVFKKYYGVAPSHYVKND